MDDTEILKILADLNYASLFVLASGHQEKFGPGELSWHRSLKAATMEQRTALVTRLEHWLDVKRSA